MLRLALLALALVPGALALANTQADPDNTLAQTGPVCIDLFRNISTEVYGTANIPCTNYVATLMAASEKNWCPDDATVKGCLTKTNATLDAWTNFVGQCGVFNIVNRGPGFAEDTSKPFSCWPQFQTPNDWKTFAQQPSSGLNDAFGVRVASGASLALPALVAALLL